MGFLASDHDLLVLLVQMSSQCYCLILVFGFLNLHYSHFSFNMSNITATSNCFFFFNQGLVHLYRPLQQTVGCTMLIVESLKISTF